MESRFSVAVILVSTFGCAGGTVFATDLPGTSEDAGKTVVYRDAWGVPHIYAPTVEGGMYAMGWTQAEDRPLQLLRNLARGMGEISRADGASGIQSDVVAKTFELYESSQENLSQIDQDLRVQTQSFVKGINDWYAAHPQDVPEWWGDRQVDEAMIVAFGRLFLHGWSIDDGFGDLRRGGVEPGVDKTQRGSNQWAISPKRSANGAAILCIDPHLSWFGPSRFWEFRIHAGELHGSGFTLAGQNSIGLGHNENVAWAMTTGGPDTADIYRLALNATNRKQYRYDGQFRDFDIREIQIEVKHLADPIKRQVLLSHHGPVVAVRNGKAYAHKMAYWGQVEGDEAWKHLAYAKDYRGAADAMATLQVFPQNVMVADTSGNIYYQRTGRVPRRPDGYDWTKPVDGSVSATEWNGFHPSSDHVQLLNPRHGFMQNCNNSPDAMPLISLSNAMSRLKQHWGSYDSVYGDKFRVGCDDKSWPAGGGSDVGTGTLRSVGYSAQRKDHTRWGHRGQTSTQIVSMTQPVQSWTSVPIGQSDRSDSPHYADQAEKLFSKGKMKPSWWLPADLAQHIKSRTVLVKEEDQGNSEP